MVGRYDNIEKLLNNSVNIGIRRKTLRHLIRIATSVIQINDFRYRICAVGFSEKGQIFVGFPKCKTHPILKDYPKQCKTMHAEADLIIKAGEQQLSSIIVVRLSRKRNKEYRLAKPCDSCTFLIRKFQPNAKIFYTTNEQDIRFMPI